MTVDNVLLCNKKIYNLFQEMLFDDVIKEFDPTDFCKFNYCTDGKWSNSCFNIDSRAKIC